MIKKVMKVNISETLNLWQLTALVDYSFKKNFPLQITIPGRLVAEIPEIISKFPNNELSLFENALYQQVNEELVNTECVPELLYNSVFVLDFNLMGNNYYGNLPKFTLVKSTLVK